MGESNSVKFTCPQVERRGLWLQEAHRTAFLLPEKTPSGCCYLRPLWDARGWFSGERGLWCIRIPAFPGSGALMIADTKPPIRLGRRRNGREGGGGLLSFPLACVSLALQPM